MSCLPVRPSQVWCDFDAHVLGITPLNTAKEHTQRETHFFRIVRASRKYHDGAPAENNRRRSLHLEVHRSFLEDKTQRSADETMAERAELHDCFLEELAVGILDASARKQLSPLTSQYAVAMLCDRLNELLRSSLSTQDRRLQAWQISAIDTRLEACIQGTMSLEDAAALCRLSICHFSRLFKSTYGTPFRRYQLNMRIDWAKQQLAHSENPISAIALDCGFSDQACFTRRFTMTTGSSPGLWRRNMKKKSPLPALSDYRNTQAVAC